MNKLYQLYYDCRVKAVHAVEPSEEINSDAMTIHTDGFRDFLANPVACIIYLAFLVVVTINVRI
jgi:hypothetical protein